MEGGDLDARRIEQLRLERIENRVPELMTQHVGALARAVAGAIDLPHLLAVGRFEAHELLGGAVHHLQVEPALVEHRRPVGAELDVELPVLLEVLLNASAAVQ